MNWRLPVELEDLIVVAAQMLWASNAAEGVDIALLSLTGGRGRHRLRHSSSGKNSSLTTTAVKRRMNFSRFIEGHVLLVFIPASEHSFPAKCSQHDIKTILINMT